MRDGAVIPLRQKVVKMPAKETVIGKSVGEKSARRQRAEQVKPFRCKCLIAVLEDPADFGNIGTVIRNANALGVEKVYIVDPQNKLPDDWEDMRDRRPLSSTSVSGVKWTFVKRFDSTEDCIAHLEKKGYASIATSPHVKGKENIFLNEGDYTTDPKLAVWFGNESRGLSTQAVAHCHTCVSIPMFGMVESLNLGTSSGIVLYEVTQQRRVYQSRFRKKGRKGERDVPLPVIVPRAEINEENG